MIYLCVNFKKIRSILIFLTIFVLANNPILKATQSNFIEDEIVTASSIARPLLRAESFDAPLSSSAQLELNNLPSDADNERTIIASINKISNSYVLAFQDDPGNKISISDACKYTLCLVGGLGPIIPQVAISQLIGENFDSKVLSYALIATSALTIEAISSWMIWELINDATNLVKNARQHQDGSGTCNLELLKNIGIGISAITLGVLSSTPDVYIKYKYNDIKWFAFISFIYDSIPRTIGFYKLFSSLQLEKIKKIWEGPDIDECQGIKILDLSRVYFIQKCKENGFENVCKTVRGYTSPDEVYSYLTSNLKSSFVEADSPHNLGRGIPRKITKYLGIIPPLASAAFNTALAYKGYNLMIDNEASLWLLSTFSVLPSFLLSSYIIMEASGNVFDKIYFCKSQIPSSDYFANFHPKLNVTLMSVAMLLASASSFSSFYLISDNLEGTILSPIKYIIAGLAVGTDFTFGTFTIYSTFKRYGELISRKCSKGASYGLNCSQKLSDLKNSLVNFSSNLIKIFVNDTIPEYN